MKLVLGLILEAEIDYLVSGFKLELYADYELSYIFSLLSNMCSIFSTSKEHMMRFFVEDLF
jgi:hypothetical protein